VKLGQTAKVTVDAVENRTFCGHVTEIGNSPIQTNSQQGGQRQATTFKVVVTLDEEVPNVRPGFTCTVEITTAKKQNIASVPIQALTVREMLFDPQGKMVHEDPRSRRRANLEPTVSASNEPPPGHKREETEGVFLLQQGKAVFTAVKIGIAGEQYFEIVEGLKPGDQVITGPFASVRELADGQQVKLQQESRRRSGTTTRSTNP
jgi:HlyD family secretion protein